MGRLQILGELWALLQKYGPAAVTIAAGAEAAYAAGGWAGLARYLAGVVANPPALPAAFHAELSDLHAKMAAA